MLDFHGCLVGCGHRVLAEQRDRFTSLELKDWEKSASGTSILSNDATCLKALLGHIHSMHPVVQRCPAGSVDAAVDKKVCLWARVDVMATESFTQLLFEEKMLLQFLATCFTLSHSTAQPGFRVLGAVGGDAQEGHLKALLLTLTEPGPSRSFGMCVLTLLSLWERRKVVRVEPTCPVKVDITLYTFNGLATLASGTEIVGFQRDLPGSSGHDLTLQGVSRFWYSSSGQPQRARVSSSRKSRGVCGPSSIRLSSPTVRHPQTSQGEKERPLESLLCCVRLGSHVKC